MSRATTDIVGREADLERIEGALAAPDGSPRVVPITGEAGIGKTTLWRHSVELARTDGSAVLVAAPSEPEQGLGHAGLADLLGSEVDALADLLPRPQLHALRLALRLDEPRVRIDATAIAFATLASLDALSTERSILVAVTTSSGSIGRAPTPSGTRCGAFARAQRESSSPNASSPT